MKFSSFFPCPIGQVTYNVHKSEPKFYFSRTIGLPIMSSPLLLKRFTNIYWQKRSNQTLIFRKQIFFPALFIFCCLAGGQVQSGEKIRLSFELLFQIKWWINPGKKNLHGNQFKVMWIFFNLRDFIQDLVFNAIQDHYVEGIHVLNATQQSINIDSPSVARGLRYWVKCGERHETF